MKVLTTKGYGHIPHLPGSRMGVGDHHCHEGQARICTENARDRHDQIIVQEKLDGTCVGVVKLGGKCIPINRAGYNAFSSPWEHHRLFAQWASESNQYERFDAVLLESERMMGEWLAQAHGTLYALPHEPFVAFDLMWGRDRLPFDDVTKRLAGIFTMPSLVHRGGPLGIAEALELLGDRGHHGALEQIEGAVWRVERRGTPDFLAKYVRPDKVDGRYLPEQSGGEAVWLWKMDALDVARRKAG